MRQVIALPGTPVKVGLAVNTMPCTRGSSRSKNDRIAGRKARLRKFHHMICELENNWVTRQALQFPSFFHPLRDIRSGDPIAAMRAVIYDAFQQQREVILRIVLEKPANIGYPGYVTKALFNQDASENTSCGTTCCASTTTSSLSRRHS